MTFNEANTVEAHRRDLLASAASARTAQFSIGLARMSGRIGGIRWNYVASDGRMPHFSKRSLPAHLGMCG
jgi:hypothetical protein